MTKVFHRTDGGITSAGFGAARQYLAARADAELGEDLAQVPFDGAGGQEQLGGDLRVGATVGGEPGRSPRRMCGTGAFCYSASNIVAASVIFAAA